MGWGGVKEESEGPGESTLSLSRFFQSLLNESQIVIYFLSQGSCLQDEQNSVF